MNKLAYILLLTILFTPFLGGCAPKCEPCLPIIQTEYKTVEVPVVYSLKRPARPVKASDQPIPLYLNEILTYVKTLEATIDGTKAKR